MSDAGRSVAVIGGGWAGCAAALALAHRGLRVTLYESAPTLGGRARRVLRDGFALDNGQHLLLGAYVETRRAIASAHGGDAAGAFALEPLAIAPLSSSQPNGITLRARALPPPFGLLIGLARARGLTMRERVGAARWFAKLRGGGYRADRGATVTHLLAGMSARMIDGLWAPLCLAALNTAPERASAQVFANVLQAAFDGDTHASDVMVPAHDLAALYPDAVAQRLTAGGHLVQTRGAAVIEDCDARRVVIACQRREQSFDAAVVAVGPHQLARAFAPGVIAREPRIADAIELVTRLDWEPITTVYLGYAGAVPLPARLVRLDDAPGQWLFDRRDILAHARGDAPQLETMLSVVISAHGAHDALDHPALVRAADAQLRRLADRLPPLAWSRVIAEQRATYACTPSATRPRGGAVAQRIYLAGDYTDALFPATLEAAVRSGHAAATALANDLDV